MSETRRELFKASVLSAVGLMSAGAVASCSPHSEDGKGGGKGKIRLIALGQQDTVILAWNEPKGPWYVFHNSAKGWEVYTYNGSLSDPNTSSTGPFDTYSWYLRNKKNLKPVSSTFNLMNSGTTVAYDFSDGYLDSTSSNYLESLIGAAGYFSQAVWNEIGKK